MKHALLVGVPERAKDGSLEPVEGLDVMAGLLDDLEGWSITTCTAEAATRSQVRAALERVVSACGPGDALLFYFFGHGGAVRFSGLRGALGRRVVFYLATLRPVGSRQRVGLLDVELSDALSRADQICGNVTAIIDCCHAAAMVRDVSIPTVMPPPWVTSLDEVEENGDDRPLLLAAESHPRIVRLFGSSSLRHAYATQGPRGRCGLLTRSFVEVVRESGLRCDRLTWDTVGHRVREWASHQRGMEEQRVVLAGPRHRLLLSDRTAPLPRSAAFIPNPDSGHGWLRVGALQGVRVGDRWGIATLTLDSDLRPRVEAEAEVRRVALDSSEVVLSNPLLQPTLGATAHLRHFEQRAAVAVEGLDLFHDRLEHSGLIRPVAPETEGTIAHIRPAEYAANALDVLDEDGHPLWLDVPSSKESTGRVIELLEDRARAHRLEQSLLAASPSASASAEIRWRWGLFEHGSEELRSLPIRPPGAHPVPRVRVGQRLWIELRHENSTPRRWFVSVLDVGIEGRLSLLNAHQPDGMEIAPGMTTYVGLRAHRRRQGLTCCWPSRVPTHEPRKQHLIVLASRRPIAMGHLVDISDPEDPTSFAVQGLGIGTIETTRSAAHRPFVESQGWTWGRIPFEVAPSCTGR